MARSVLLALVAIGAGVAGLGACSRDGAAPSAENEVAAADAGTDAATTVEEDGPFDAKEADEIGRLFGQIVLQRHPPGTTGVKRAVFLKPHGCAKGTFTLAEGLPERFRVGLFAGSMSPARHDAWVRISSDTVPSTSDQRNSTIGLAVKVLGVPGTKVLPGEEHFTTHDFLLQNHPVFFVDTATEFLDFTRAIFAGTTPAWLAEHPTTAAILAAMKKPVPNVLAIRYWSTTPYRFGDRDFAKYAARPCREPAPEAVPVDEDNYLRRRMERDVATTGACFELLAQLRGDAPGAAERMPLDRATVEWTEADASFVTVATIEVPPQDILSNDAICEDLSFTAWHALPAHRPVGSVNKARGIVYKQHADNRRARNGVTLAEPE